MSREIKFRAWDTKGRCMLQHHEINFNWLQSGDFEFFIPMQYTGLKDKNGKEIYEGDWLRGIKKQQKDKEGLNAFPVNDIVVSEPGGFRVFSKPMQNGYTRENNVLYQFMWCDPGHHATPSYFWQIDDIEVIGNIYSTPELLTQ